MSTWLWVVTGIVLFAVYTLLFSLGAVSARADEETCRDAARARLRPFRAPTIRRRAGRHRQGAAR